MPRVIISTGHTANNPGSVYKNLKEYDVARKIAKYALRFIRQNGIISLSTPPDLELQQRIDWINSTGYSRESNDIAIEIHINDGGESGIEAWYEGNGNNPSQNLANIILDEVAKESHLNQRFARSEQEHPHGSIAFVNSINPHAIVLECGFIDGDYNFLSDELNLEKCGLGIARGVLRYYNLEFYEPKKEEPQYQTTTPAPTPTQAYNKPKQEFYNDEYDDYDDSPSASTEYFNKVKNEESNLDNTNYTNTNTNAYYNTNYNNSNNINNQPETTATQMPTPTQPQQGIMSRDERRNMIINTYQKVLGYEPNQNDLNYFMNVGINYQDLLQRMIDSQEHYDMVMNKKKAAEMSEEFSKLQSEYRKLKILYEDQKTIFDKFQESIEQKNIAIQNIQNELNDLKKENKKNEVTVKKTEEKPAPEYKASFKSKLLKKLSDLLE